MKIVIGGKWFDKINGNTYYNGKIIDGITGGIVYTGYAYGYGKAYVHQAQRMYPDEKIIDGGEFYIKKTDCKNGRF